MIEFFQLMLGLYFELNEFVVLVESSFVSLISSHDFFFLGGLGIVLSHLQLVHPFGLLLHVLFLKLQELMFLVIQLILILQLQYKYLKHQRNLYYVDIIVPMINYHLIKHFSHGLNELQFYRLVSPLLDISLAFHKCSS